MPRSSATCHVSRAHPPRVTRSVRHPDEPKGEVECLYAQLQADRAAAGLDFPIPPDEFGPYAAKFVQARVLEVTCTSVSP